MRLFLFSITELTFWRCFSLGKVIFPHIPRRAWVFLSSFSQAYTSIYIYRCIYTYTYTFIYLVCVHIYIHMHTPHTRHIHAHTSYIHTHTYYLQLTFIIHGILGTLTPMSSHCKEEISYWLPPILLPIPTKRVLSLASQGLDSQCLDSGPPCVMD